MVVFVGCDLGTMGSKAAVVDEEGRLLGEAFEEVPLERPRAGWVEQDPLRIEASAHRVVHEAVAASGRADDVAAIAFSGQMSGIGTADAGFRPATHYDSWLDTRCEPYIQRMSEHADRVVALAGCPPTYCHGPKLLWWREERPDVYRRIRRFLPIGSFVAARACGLSVDDAFVDHTYLHFSNLADTAAGTWSDELLELFGVDPEVLPRIVEPTAVVGELTPDAAAATGLAPGTPVAAGAGDTAAAALGAGVVGPGRAFDLAGTASVLAIGVDGFHPDHAAHTMMATRGVVPGTFVNLAFINGGGLALRWFRDEIATHLAGDPEAYRKLDEAAADVAVGAEGLLWFPHLQGRVLPPAPHARGSWVGLTSRHSTAHLYRALLEGIAFEYAEWVRLADQAGGQRVTEARALGGGAASVLWNQIKADVLGIDWIPTLVQECGVLGDALIAAIATGHVTDAQATIERWQATGDAVGPDPHRHARYVALQPAYRVMAESLGPVFDRLAETT
ncbi:FGGY-family carbohydrate kinase [Egicoccus sp. AB-alg2]|uniref:xylulokinase n=1 Tax=Egicoccus sp. AB-alg2 TaxID=3242693 RepID=UPI00359DCFC6